MKAKSSKQSYTPTYLTGFMLLNYLMLTVASPFISNLTNTWFQPGLVANIADIAFFVVAALIVWYVYDYFAKKLGMNQPSSSNAPTASKLIAVFIDIVLALMVFSTLTLFLFGQYDPNSISVEGWRSALPLAFTLAYFVVADRYFGGTIGKRLLGIK